MEGIEVIKISTNKNGRLHVDIGRERRKALKQTGIDSDKTIKKVLEALVDGYLPELRKDLGLEG